MAYGLGFVTALYLAYLRAKEPRRTKYAVYKDGLESLALKRGGQRQAVQVGA